jgi:hypothetical protein
VTFARDASDGPAGRDYVALWETALVESGLPLAINDAGRPRFALGAPLPTRTAGRAELADVWLCDRVPGWLVREALVPVLPPGHELVSIDDVWLGAPALAGRTAAADYLVTLPMSAGRDAVAAAAARLMATDRLSRERPKGGGTKTYDLRPLLVSIDVVESDDDGAADATDRPVVLRIRGRIHPELGSGRPDEILAALADEVGRPLEPIETVRERLVLGDDLVAD